MHVEGKRGQKAATNSGPEVHIPARGSSTRPGHGDPPTPLKDEPNCMLHSVYYKLFTIYYIISCVIYCNIIPSCAVQDERASCHVTNLPGASAGYTAGSANAGDSRSCVRALLIGGVV